MASEAKPLFPAGVRAVVLDAVGTLIVPEPPAPRVYAAVGGRYGSRLAPEVIAQRFAAAFRWQEAVDRAAGFRTSEPRELERWRYIVATVLDDVSDPEACFRELFEHFSRPDAWRCDPDAEAVLRELAGRGYTLAMASNYDRRLRRVAAGKPELQLLRHLVISSEVGWRKPAAGFFEALCRSLGHPADQILHVGDDPANDYEGAHAAGLHALLFDPNGEAPTGVDRIRHLREFLKG
jgi:putative hydrolase of the HAD superfamily